MERMTYILTELRVLSFMPKCDAGRLPVYAVFQCQAKQSLMLRLSKDRHVLGAEIVQVERLNHVKASIDDFLAVQEIEKPFPVKTQPQYVASHYTLSVLAMAGSHSMDKRNLGRTTYTGLMN